MIFAESPTVGPEILPLILIPLLIVLLTLVAVMVFGCVFANQAGKGSVLALVGWIVIGVGELFFLALGLQSSGGLRTMTTLVPAAALAIQVGLFISAKRGDGGSSGSRDRPD